METLKISEEELGNMKQFYLEEYERTSSRLNHILTMMKKLGMDVPPEDLHGITAGKPAGPGKPKKKPGRKSRWEMLILKRMRQLDRPVTYDELTEELMTSAKLPEEKRTSTRQAIVNVVFRLRNRDQKLDTFSAGTREKYIALKSWFKSPGVIKREYASKIIRP